MSIHGDDKYGRGKRAGKLGIIGIPLMAALVFCTVLLYNFFGSSAVNAEDLMKDTTPAKISATELSDDFIKSASDFSIDLFKESITGGKNSLISPTSVYLALAMTGNGAGEKTLEEFETVLGRYNLTMDDINKYCYSYNKHLTDIKSGKLSIANSIWFRQDDYLKVNKSFLQINADYYNASAYKTDFNSQKTVDDINNWVKLSTDKLIDKIIDKIDPNTVMYLINAICFDKKWRNVYNKNQIRNGKFILDDGDSISTDFMYSDESIYLEDDSTQGFIKPYEDGKYSFAALLPKDGVSIDNYVSNLTGKEFLSLIKGRTNTSVNTGLPKFKCEYTKQLAKPLKTMGIIQGFNSNLANFSKMGSSERGNIYIGDVLHKTFIQVDELGTKAGAVTKVEMQDECAALEVKSVILNRPFVYAIIDNKTSLPVFIGVMHNPQ